MTDAAHEIALPNMGMFILPGRAYLRSIIDQNLPMRRAAVADARSHFDSLEGTGFEKSLAVVGLIGDALQLVEDVAALGNSFFNSPPGIGFFAVAATYEPNAINRFYDGLHKRPLQDFVRLAALGIGDDWIHDHFTFEPPLTTEEETAAQHAHEATAKLLRGHLLHLRDQWRQFRSYFHAFKHGMLVGDPRDVTVVEADRVTEIDQIVVWRRKRDVPSGAAAIEPPFEAVCDYVEQAAGLAAELVEHLSVQRLRLFEHIEIEADGSWRPRPAKRLPWLWWLHERDLEEGDKELLDARFGVAFERVD
ncbi:MAG: hypothetical protein M3P18_20000 [Actinomycetota bacterium]|nr:hypothetical protein [Actinomycetota bacterium]